jgi:hypothetical protein
MSTCGLTWHQLRQPDGDTIWFRFLVRLRDAQRTILYRIGSTPDDSFTRTIWCYDGKAWTCDACGLLVETLPADAIGT